MRMKKIATLIRLHKLELDEKRRVLVALRQQLENMQTAQTRLAQELLDEQHTAKQGLELGMTYHGYAKHYTQRREKLLAEIAAQEIEIEKAELLVQMSYQELKKYEITAEKQAIAEKYQQDRKDQTDMDEVAATRHQRNKKG
jgi:flagellar protein FliJ